MWPLIPTEYTRGFQDSPRMFNNGVALGTKEINNWTVKEIGPVGAFKICREVKRSISGIVSRQGQESNCIRIYFCDPDYQDNGRTDCNQPNRLATDPRRPKDLQAFWLLQEALAIDWNNRYIDSFKQVIQHLRDENIPLAEVHS